MVNEKILVVGCVGMEATGRLIPILHREIELLRADKVNVVSLNEPQMFPISNFRIDPYLIKPLFKTEKDKIEKERIGLQRHKAKCERNRAKRKNKRKQKY